MIPGLRVLLAAADDDIKRFVKHCLKDTVTLLMANDTAECLEKADKVTPHLFILQGLHLSISVTDICNRIKAAGKFKHARTMVLTASADDLFAVNAWQAGADDAVILPVSHDIFINRIKALLRRTDFLKRERLVFEKLIISPETFTVIQGEHEIALPKKEFKLLHLLATIPGRVFSRTEIMEMVWEDGVLVGNRTIDVHVRKIRAKLHMDCIQTVKGLGYKFTLADQPAGIP